MRKIALTALIGAISFSPAFADGHDTKTTIIHAGQMLDVESGEMLKDQFIIIDGTHIRDVVTLRDMEDMADEEVELIDLSDMTVLPGLSDAHVHLTGDANIHGYKRLTRSTPRAAITGVRNAKRTLMAGFTTVRNVGAPGFADVDLMEAIEDGDVPGPRIIPAGRSIGITGGHCDNNLLPFENRKTAGGVADGPWAVRAKVRENKKFGAKVIKFCGTGGVLSKGTKVGAQQFSFEEMKAIVDEAHMRELPVAAHAHGTNGIKTAIKAGVDSVEHASFLDDEAIELAIKHGTWLSMDIYNTEYTLSFGEQNGVDEENLNKERLVSKKQRDSFKRAVEAGVNMVFGTDAAIYPHGDNAKQFSRMVEFGMSELQAIQAATINSAKLLKADSQLGQIKTGFAADIIAVSANPLKNISTLERIPFVMKAGVVYKQ